MLDPDAYEYYENRVSAQLASFLRPEDYDNLIDLALDVKDFEWAKKLLWKKKRRIQYLNRKYGMK